MIYWNAPCAILRWSAIQCIYFQDAAAMGCFGRCNHQARCKGIYTPTRYPIPADTCTLIIVWSMDYISWFKSGLRLYGINRCREKWIHVHIFKNEGTSIYIYTYIWSVLSPYSLLRIGRLVIHYNVALSRDVSKSKRNTHWVMACHLFGSEPLPGPITTRITWLHKTCIVFYHLVING